MLLRDKGERSDASLFDLPQTVTNLINIPK